MSKEKGKLWSAIWTPTDADGKLLKKEMKTLLEFQAERGVEGILVGGSTGQFLHLNLSTRKELLDFIFENRGSLEVVCNVSHTNPREVEELIRYANDFPLTGIILLPPMYYPINQQDMAEYFIHMGSKSKNPFYLYSFPERTNAPIPIETVEAVCDKIPLAGVKLSGGDLVFFIAIIELAKKKHFKVYCGNDTLMPECMILGADGCMGGLVNVIPELYAEAMNSAHHNRTKELEAIGSKLKALKKPLSQLFFPWNISAFMEARSLPIGTPKMPLSTTSAMQYQKTVEEFRGLLQMWELNPS